MTQNEFQHVHLEYVSLRTSFFETQGHNSHLNLGHSFYGDVTLTANLLLLSTIGLKARTETRTKWPQSPKDRKDRKCQDRANNREYRASEGASVDAKDLGGSNDERSGDVLPTNEAELI